MEELKKSIMALIKVYGIDEVAKAVDFIIDAEYENWLKRRLLECAHNIRKIVAGTPYSNNVAININDEYVSITAGSREKTSLIIGRENVKK